MMLFPFKRRTWRRSLPVGQIFSPTVAPFAGRFTFDRFHDNEDIRNRFELLISVSFFAAVEQAAVLLEFVNPTPGGSGAAGDPPISITGFNTDRMVLLSDNTGLLTSFVENNEGAWWPVPWREKPDLPYELHFTTQAGDSAGDVRTLQVEMVWIPRWPCAGLNDYLARLATRDPTSSAPPRPVDPSSGEPWPGCSDCDDPWDPGGLTG